MCCVLNLMEKKSHWIKSLKKRRPKKKEKEVFDDGRRKTLADTDKGSVDAAGLFCLKDFLPLRILQRNTNSTWRHSHALHDCTSQACREIWPLGVLQGSLTSSIAYRHLWCEVDDIYRAQQGREIIINLLKRKKLTSFLRVCPVFERIYRVWEFDGLTWNLARILPRHRKSKPCEGCPVFKIYLSLWPFS